MNAADTFSKDPQRRPGAAIARLRFLWKYARRWKWHIVLSLLGLAIVSAASLLYPWLLKQLADQLASPGAHPDPIRRIIFIGFVFVTAAIVGHAAQVEMQSLGYRLRNALRVDFFHRVLRYPMAFFSEHQVGELSVKATEDISRLQPFFSGLIAPLFQNLLVIGGCLIFMARISFVASAATFLLMAIPLPFIIRSGRRILHLSAAGTDEHARANALLEESIVGIREIKAFGREGTFAAEYGAHQERASKSELSSARLHVRINQWISLLLSIILLSVFAAGTSGHGLNGWTIGSVIAFYFYAYTAVMAAVGVGRVYLTYQGISGALDKTFKLMGTMSVHAPEASTQLDSIVGGIEFRSVSFHYVPEHPVLRNVSFRIEPGSTILLRGDSGSGKTTLVNLMIGLHNPVDGIITLDGCPLAELERPSLHRAFGYVGQDPLLFHGTLEENILFSGQPTDHRRFLDVLRISCVDEILEELPCGISTIVGERGFTLSGGQRTRVAIARAIMHRPAVLILDESSSMLGEDLERRFWDRLLEDRRGMTTIILSHHHENLPEVFAEWQLEHGVVRQVAESGIRKS